jgi:hypothetical protein
MRKFYGTKETKGRGAYEIRKKITVLFLLITCICFGQNNSHNDIYIKSIDTKKTITDSLTTLSIEKKSENIIDRENKKSKLQGFFELGYQKGRQINQSFYRNRRIKLNAIAAYQISPYYSLGVGTGLRYYLPEQWSLVPLFANFMGTIQTKKYLPYFSLSVGTLFETDDFNYQGYFFDPRLGVSIKTKGKCNINIAVNYEFQFLKLPENYEKWFGPTCILIGLSF